MKIQDLLDMENLVRRIGEGMIRERQHPKYPQLRTLGYTEAAQWSRTWDHETTTCRGLIYDAATGEVIARPYPKFFNHSEYNQTEGPLAGMTLDLRAEVEVADKVDGSLGILFDNPYSGNWEIATRGSFDSDQARKANAEFLPALLEKWTPYADVTTLFEIVYPDNRIVLDYEGWEGLILLGGVETRTGRIFGPRFDSDWPDRRADTFLATNLADALHMEPRPNAEGLVVRYVETGQMVKIKQEDYVRLHKIITGLSDKAVWEHLSQHRGDISGMVEVVPDEFHGWLMETTSNFLDRYAQIEREARADFDVVCMNLDVPPGAQVSKDNVDRRLFAQYATKSKHAHLVFRMLDGRDLSEPIWKTLRPVGVRYMSNVAVEGEVA